MEIQLRGLHLHLLTVADTGDSRREDTVAVNPFWSQKARDEAQLAAARPAFLDTNSGPASSGSTEMRVADDTPLMPVGNSESFGPSATAAMDGFNRDQSEEVV